MFTLTQGSQAGLFPVKGQCKRLCSDLFRVLVSSSFFLSGNISIGHNSKMPWAITIKLGHNNNDPLPFISHDPQGSKGHTGVTGVKSVISFKSFQLKQKMSNYDIVLAYASSQVSAQMLPIEKKFKGHQGSLPGQNWKYFKKSISAKCRVVELFYLHR